MVYGKGVSRADVPRARKGWASGVGKNVLPGFPGPFHFKVEGPAAIFWDSGALLRFGLGGIVFP